MQARTTRCYDPSVGNPYRAIGRPNARGTQMASGALVRLSGAPRSPQRDLQQLARAWWTKTSCMIRRLPEPHGKPTLEGIEVVLGYLGHADHNIAAAAAHAIHHAAVVLETERYEDLPSSIWKVTSATTRVRDGLESSVFWRRLQAADLAFEHPCIELAETLLLRLEDPVFSVRWRAVAALARLEQTPRLVDALVVSLPHSVSLPNLESLRESQWTRWEPLERTELPLDFVRALSAIGPERSRVLDAMAERPRRT